MGFEKYKPKRSYSTILSKKIVRVAFRTGQKAKDPSKPIPITINIDIGLEVAKQIGLLAGKKIDFYVDQDNSRLWLIKKSENPMYGYTLSKSLYSLKLAFTWDKFSPNENDYKFREVKHDLHDGGLRIYGNVENIYS